MNKSEKRKYFIPISGKLYETNEIIYKTYYSMYRRERYLEERSRKHELSYDALIDANYPIEDKVVDKPNNIEDDVVSHILIEEIFLAVSKLTEKEKWLIKELFFYGKSERKVSAETSIPRKTISYRKNKILNKLQKLIK